MVLTAAEKQFMQTLCSGLSILIDPTIIRVEEMEKKGLVQKIGPRVFDVTVTQKGKKLIKKS
ncbi:hypothetical protein [Roseibium sp.]|uniref:hypothetical protein n=1 Tax=Roseibium sp. TaxID=1936156 RepID=UPI003B50ACEE